LVTLLAELRPDVEIVGLDPDPKALARAARKAKRFRTAIRLDRGFADHLSYSDAAFDRVFSSFMFHHLPAEEKEPTLAEVRRVLRPGGSFHMLDFAGTEHSHGVLMRLTHASERLKDNAEDHVLELLRRAGFARAEQTGKRTMLFGRLAYYVATA
jgi:ubiquinone/menaquinone biosynthesis C-methylase UbiE